MMRTERIMAVWLVLVVCASAWALDANDPNLVSYWKFDEGSGTTAYDSAGTNHGILNGDPNWVTGKVGEYALDFDGTDGHVQVNDAAYLDGMDALTVMAWVKTGSTGYMGVIDKYVHHSGNNWDDSYCLHINDGGTVLFQYAPGDAYVVKVSSVTVADDSWHHVAGVYTGGEGSIYIDGVDVPLSRDDFDPGGGLNNTDETLRIGCFNNNGNLSEFFVGKIDEIAIFNRALSAQEIEQIYYETLLDPFDLLIELSESIDAMYLHKGLANSLQTKLDTATRLLEDTNENNDIAAINSLQAFINAVEAQYGKKISEDDADILITAAQEIIELLSG